MGSHKGHSKNESHRKYVRGEEKRAKNRTLENIKGAGKGESKGG